MMKILKRLIVILFVVINLIFSSIVVASINNRLLVDVAWLVKHSKDDKTIIIDVRNNDDYLVGHIPNSINIPVSDTFNPEINTDRLANSAHIQTLFSNAGLEYNDTIILYDSGKHIDAGRVFWVFEVYGHNNVKLLSGGYPAWTNKTDNPVSQTTPEITRSNYIPRLEPHRLTTKLSMRLALDDNTRIIIDARSEEEYVGKKSIAKRAGHIPNSINIPWSDNFTKKDGIKVLKPIPELKKIYEDLDLNKKVYLYCNKGKQSTLTYSVMRQLGFDAAHYDGSWYEWGNDELLPIK